MPEQENPATPTPEPSSPTARTKAIRATRSIKTAQDDVVSRAVDRRNPDRLTRAFAHARLAAKITDDNRAKDILLLDLRGVTPLLDFFVIATANSRRQANAIASEIDAEMKKIGELKLGMEGSEEGRWILIDYGDFVVHIFSGDGRTYYALEEIWGDAPQLSWRDEPGAPAGELPPPPTMTTTDASTPAESTAETPEKSSD
ncbi:ribosome silencing factor [Paludisphaera borealis]|uniref:Ribosomal silencing factor RsfS n=1 Tax=Paludisphaera borealis TaxID=1387353 RepID=A0A1U7CWU2_9BACT|nr:ribosome silencing factor [Paludisphaera borealis]APW63359.1 Ribosomal silencing factor RsfS [Paludisphaera borealis]